MRFDFKKEYKELYQPPAVPTIIDVPPIKYMAVRGKGDPNVEDSEYKRSLALLYGVAYTLKMSYKGGRQIAGYFDYVVPPPEGLWWQEGRDEIDYDNKEGFRFISIMRLPDFVTQADWEWAIQEATAKKKTDFSAVEWLVYDEGLCVQCMHKGAYDDEPQTIRAMHDYAEARGYAIDINERRYHHEIYCSDPRRCEAAKLKTVIRLPITKVGV